jgi:hypothetical protein
VTELAELDRARPVRVHRTWGDEPGLWTVVQDGQIAAYADEIGLAVVTFVIEPHEGPGPRPASAPFAWATGWLCDPVPLPHEVRFDRAAEGFFAGLLRLEGADRLSFIRRAVTADGITGRAGPVASRA